MNDKPPLRQYYTRCCESGVEVVSGDEGTNYYVCVKCKEPADPYRVDIEAQNEKQFVELVLNAIDWQRKAGNDVRVLGHFNGFIKFEITDPDERHFKKILIHGTRLGPVLRRFDTPEARTALQRWFEHRKPKWEPEFENELRAVATLAGFDEKEHEFDRTFEELCRLLPWSCGNETEGDSRMIWVDMGLVEMALWCNNERWSGHVTIGKEVVGRIKPHDEAVDAVKTGLRDLGDSVLPFWEKRLGEIKAQVDDLDLEE